MEAGQILLNPMVQGLCPEIIVPLLGCDKADGPDFDSLAANYYRPLYRFAVTLTRDEADACDLTIGTVKSRLARSIGRLYGLLTAAKPKPPTP